MTCYLYPGPVELVDISLLQLTLPIRPLDPAHVDVLSGVLGDCPPLVVAARTMVVIDGYHRLAAALQLGWTQVAVLFSDADDAGHFVQAVAGNSDHGLPLTKAERMASARRMASMVPALSNSVIAGHCGLSEPTVRRMPRPGASEPQVDTRRVGRDGKAYPVGEVWKELAVSLLAESDLSYREIARRVGRAPTTIGKLRAEQVKQTEAVADRPGCWRRLVDRLRTWWNSVLGRRAAPLPLVPRRSGAVTDSDRRGERSVQG